ncbi:hypothetical protein D3C87_1454940 [compost metagenome]
MQHPNFPNEIFRVVFYPGKPGEAPTVNVTAIPAKYNQASVATANRRRIAFDKLGKIETLAESHNMHIVRAWVQSREHIPEIVTKMHTFVRGATQKKLEAIQRMQTGLNLEPILCEQEYEDD